MKLTAFLQVFILVIPSPGATPTDPFRFRFEGGGDDPFRVDPAGEEGLERSKRSLPSQDSLGPDNEDVPRGFRSAIGLPKQQSSLDVQSWIDNGYSYRTCNRIVQMVECTGSEVLVSSILRSTLCAIIHFRSFFHRSESRSGMTESTRPSSAR